MTIKKTTAKGHHIKFKDKTSMTWFRSDDFESEEEMMSHYWGKVRGAACEVEFHGPKGEVKKVAKEELDTFDIRTSAHGLALRMIGEATSNTSNTSSTSNRKKIVGKVIAGAAAIPVAAAKSHADSSGVSKIAGDIKSAYKTIAGTKKKKLKKEDTEMPTSKDIVELAITGDAVGLKEAFETAMTAVKEGLTESKRPEAVAAMFGSTVVSEKEIVIDIKDDDKDEKKDDKKSEKKDDKGSDKDEKSDDDKDDKKPPFAKKD